MAERGRSLGMILLGAQQTASEVERRIVANSAVRVVGRLDAAEAARGEYGFLPRCAAAGPRSSSPARCSSPSRSCPCPCWWSSRPLWATRASEAGPAPGAASGSTGGSGGPDDPFDGLP